MRNAARTQLLRLATVLLVGAVTAGCGLFDSGIEWQDGPFALLWIDEPDDVGLSYELGQGGWGELVAPRVFAVGADSRYVVAQQHPDGNQSVTNYFIVDKRQGPALKRGSTTAVVGPLTAAEFRDKSLELGLPAFTKTLGWLTDQHAR